MRTFYKIFVCAVLLLGLDASRALALEITPATFDLALNPGTQQVQNFVVTNDEDQMETYYFSIQKFIPQGDQGQQAFLPPTEIEGLPSWTYLDQASVTLQPHAQKAVRFALQIPETANAGGYYEAIFVSTVPAQSSSTSGVAIGTRVGALLFVQVNGALVEHAMVDQFELQTPQPIHHLPLEFKVRIQNQGNIHIVPQGTLVIRDTFGRVVQRLPINAAQGRVLPDSAREFTVQTGSLLQDSEQGWWAQTRIELANWALGRYTATLDMTPLITSYVPAQVIWIWPVHVLMTAFIAFMLFVIFLISFRRWVIYQATIR